MYLKILVLVAVLSVVESKFPLYKDFVNIAEEEGIVFQTTPEMKKAFKNFRRNYRQLIDQKRKYRNSGYMTKMSSVDFYTNKQFKMTLGAKLEPNLKIKKFKVNKKRNLYANVNTIRYFDSTRNHNVNDVVNQGICGNCYLHATVAAIEIAYTKATGKLKKFSEQELTDCYYRGCGGGDYRQVCKTLAVTNRLSERSMYGDYLSKVNQCRAFTSPDGLDVMQIVDSEVVTADTIEAAITIHGSVMTCLDWEHSCAHIKNYGGGIFNGPVSDSCDHAVLIVGYTPSYYKVRNSHGKTWGEKGYFRIKRGNTCGIENNMAVLKVKNLSKAKDNMKSGCPRDRPMFCKETMTCTSQPCISFDKEAAPPVKHPEPVCEDDPKLSCSRLTRMCGSSSIKSRCKKTCDNCDAVGGREAGGSPFPMNHTPVVVEGPCVIPKIANGRVVTDKIQFESGDEVDIECNPGYTLVGEKIHCMVQDTFGPDSRLMPECIKIDDATPLSGNGTDYIGSKSVSVSGKKCLNWNKSVYKGELVTTVEITKLLMAGNHDYCRNPGGLMLGPFCVVSTMGDMEYCFKFPGCDMCDSESKDADKFCRAGRSMKFCEFTETDKSNQFLQAWTECRKSCCEDAKCPLTPVK